MAMAEPPQADDCARTGPARAAADAPWHPILDFWFLPKADPASGADRAEWFRKDAAFDATIRDRFGAEIDAAITGAYADWDRDPHGALARIILLDQFTRNVFRDTPRAFAGDSLALAAAKAMVDSGRHRLLDRVERSFVYLPFEHAEDLDTQERGVTLFEALGRESGREGAAEWAIRHRDIIARFGRFPHRNQILDRASTSEETEFLKTPGSGF